MLSFWEEILEPALKALAPERILEIGSDTGATTRALLGFAETRGSVVHAIDPSPRFVRWYRQCLVQKDDVPRIQSWRLMVRTIFAVALLALLACTSFALDPARALDLDAIESNGYGFQVEVNYRAHALGFHIVEVPIRFADRTVGRSKMSSGIVFEAARVVWGLRGSAPRPAAARPTGAIAMGGDLGSRPGRSAPQAAISDPTVPSLEDAMLDALAEHVPVSAAERDARVEVPR